MYEDLNNNNIICEHEFNSDYSLLCRKCGLVCEWDFENIFESVSRWLINAKNQGYSAVDVKPLKYRNVNHIAIKLLETGKVIGPKQRTVKVWRKEKQKMIDELVNLTSNYRIMTGLDKKFLTETIDKIITNYQNYLFSTGKEFSNDKG